MDVFFSIPFGHVLDVAAAAMGIIFSQYCFFRLILFFFKVISVPFKEEQKENNFMVNQCGM